MSVWLSLARSKVSRRLLGILFTYMSFVIPAKRLRETNTLIAFHHPRPSYPLHILIVPKRNKTSLMDLTTSDNDFLSDLITAVQSLVREFDLEPPGYRLINNGGAYQDVAQLHFHLVSGN